MEHMECVAQFVIVDEHPLRGAALESLFSNWAMKEGLEIKRVSSFEKVVRAPSTKFEMCLLNIGGMSLRDAKSWQMFCALKKKFSEQPVVVILDSVTDADVRVAYLGGASGLICTTTYAEVVVAALSFIRSGGEYFPPIAWRESVRENVQDGLPGQNGFPIMEPSNITDRSRGLSIGFPASRNGGDRPCEAPVDLPAVLDSQEPTSDAQLFTRRQDDVLDLVKLGRSNKEIARTLNLSESTVKIHMRQLMKKMGVTNRTQVALRATQPKNCLSEH